MLDEMEPLEDPGSFGGIQSNRTCTDKGAIFGMLLFFMILFGLLGYGIAKGDLDRIFKGYDDCGNVCGKNNIKTDEIKYECFGKNLKQEKYLLYGFEDDIDDAEHTTRTCVTNCADNDAYVDVLNRCYPNSMKKNNSGNFATTNSIFKKLSADFQICWKYMILLAFLALVFSIIMMILMRYATTFLVWFVLISICGILIALTTYSWIRFKQISDEGNKKYHDTYLSCSVVLTILTIGFLLIIFVMFKRIKLVIQLFKESAKALADVPLLLFQPVFTFIVLSFALCLSCYTSLWILSYGELDKSPDNPRAYDYVVTTFNLVVPWYNFIAVLWIVQFVIGCQNMIIAGAIATWFFSKDKSNLGSPILTSTKNLLKYHLGTIALGSLIITIVQVIKSIIASLRESAVRNDNTTAAYILLCCSCIVQLLEDLVKYLSRNAYIVTAIYGTSFCKSGRHACSLLKNNIFKVIVINSVGDYVLAFIKLFVVAVTVLIAAELYRHNNKIHYLWFPLVVVALISYFIVNCFIYVFEMTIDTLFICFCEDCLHNDGVSKPYYMSRNLMEFIENSSKMVDAAKWTETEQEAWENGPRRVLQRGH